MLEDTVNKRAVYILLECNLVSFDFRVSAHCYVSHVTVVRSLESKDRIRISCFSTMYTVEVTTLTQTDRNYPRKEVNVKHLVQVIYYQQE